MNTDTAQRDQTMTELDMLFDFAKDAEVAAMSYAAAAGLAQDEQLRELFRKLAQASWDSQQRTVQLSRKLGGKL